MITSETSKIQQIDDLDAVRGIGILMVFFFHVTGYFKYEIPFLPPFLKSFISAGHSGVTLLFVLSSFLLFQSYIKASSSGITPSWKKFYMRRALRILPMYLFMVLISVLALKNYKISFMALNIFWGVNGQKLYPIAIGWWAIFTEIQFYVLMPVIGFFIAHNRRRNLVLLFIGYLILYYMFFTKWTLVFSLELFLRLIHSLLGQGFVFIIGAVSSWFFVFHGDKIKTYFTKKSIVTKWWADALLVINLAFLGGLLWTNCYVGYWKMETSYPLWHIIEALLWSAFILSLLLLPLKFKEVISNGFFKLIGKISYSIYLLHYPILVYGYMAIEKLSSAAHLPVPSKGILIIIIFVLCTGASALTYRFIEKPFLERKQHFY